MLSLTGSKGRSSAPLDPEFEQLKPLMEELYMKQGKTRDELSRCMEQYGLKASKHQYEKAFKRWRWSKNDSSSFWDAVCVSVFRLKNGANKLEVFKNGDKIDDDQIQSQMKRRSAAFFQHRQAAPTSLPNGVAVLSRNDRTSTMFFQLPFHIFMESTSITEHSGAHSQRSVNVSASLVEETPIPNISQWPSALTRLECHPSALPLATLFPDPVKARTLEAVTFPVLSSTTMSQALRYRLDMQVGVMVHHWQTLLSIANNFAGLSGLDVELFFRFLRNEMGQYLRAMVQRSPTCCTMRSLISNILKASIGIGDAETIGFILGQRINGIDANNLVCSIRGVQCTALEKAMSLVHTDVVKVLLHYGATVWLSEPQRKHQGSRNALDVFLKSYTSFDRSGDGNEIVSMLMLAGGKVTCSTLKELIDRDRIGLAHLLLENDMVLDMKHLVRKEVFHTAMKKLDETFFLKMLRYLDKVRSDIDFRPGYRERGWYLPPTLLEVAVKWERVRVVQELLTQGATIHRPALIYALEIGGQEMAEMLFKHQTRFHLYPQDSDSCEEVKDVSSPRSSTVSQDDATLDVTRPFDSGRGHTDAESRLLTAIRDGLSQEAEALIDSGADVNAFGGASLQEALTKRNATLVFSLLNAGADPNLFGSESPYDGHSRIPAIDLAVRWGDHTVIQHLIEAGASKWARSFVEPTELPALVIAVQRSDMALVRQLLHSVVSPDSSLWVTAIQAAVYGDDVQMVRLLLTSGVCVQEQDERRMRGKFRAVIFYYSRDYYSDIALEDGELTNAEIFDQRHQWSHPGVTQFNEEDSADDMSLLSENADGSDTEAADQEAEREAWYHYIRYDEDRSSIQCDGNLDLREYSKELCDLVLDAFKIRNFPLYEHIILQNLRDLIESPWPEKHDDFTKFMEERWPDISAAAATSQEFKVMYYAAIVTAKRSDTCFLQKLLEHGCSPQSLIYDSVSVILPCRPHLTAFLGAISTGNTDIVKLFIQYKADVNFVPRVNVKRTPLQQAASHGYLDIAKLLIVHGASINAPAARFGGATALQFAAIGGYHAIIDLLINYGAEVDALAAKRDGRTALEGAAEHGRTDTVKVLLNAGAANNGRDRAQMESAIRYADDKGYPYISDMLRDHLKDDRGSDQDLQPNSHEPVDEFFDWSRWDKDTLPIR